MLHRDVSADMVYQRLMRDAPPDDAGGFDRHVIACILALAHGEAADRQVPLTDTAGLSADTLAALIGAVFPHAGPLFSPAQPMAVTRSADETCLLDLLESCMADARGLGPPLAAMIARRAQSPNHLWQDLGLRNRGELSRLMRRHFPVLAARNTGDMKWKKFLYRMICRDAGYALCTAPSCAECTDFDACFGDESGESRLARTRRAVELDHDAPAMRVGA